MAHNSTSEPLEDEEQFPASESPSPATDSEGERTSPPTSTSWHPSFLTLLALFVAFRLLTLLLLRPGGFIRDWSDFDTYLGIAALSDYGLYPFLHYWLEWPPLVPWLAVGAYQLSLLFPPWTDNRLWFILILGTVFVLFETGNFVLLYRIAGRVHTALNGGEVPSSVNEPSDVDRSPADTAQQSTEEEPENQDDLRSTQYAVRRTQYAVRNTRRRALCPPLRTHLRHAGLLRCDRPFLFVVGTGICFARSLAQFSDLDRRRICS